MLFLESCSFSPVVLFSYKGFHVNLLRVPYFGVLPYLVLVKFFLVIDACYSSLVEFSCVDIEFMKYTSFKNQTCLYLTMVININFPNATLVSLDSSYSVFYILSIYYFRCR